MPASKKKFWFYKKRGSYLPQSWEGMALYLLYCVYLVALPIAWYHGGHTLWQLLTEVVPLAVAAAWITQFIASKHAK